MQEFYFTAYSWKWERRREMYCRNIITSKQCTVSAINRIFQRLSSTEQYVSLKFTQSFWSSPEISLSLLIVTNTHVCMHCIQNVFCPWLSCSHPPAVLQEAVTVITCITCVIQILGLATFICLWQVWLIENFAFPESSHYYRLHKLSGRQSKLYQSDGLFFWKAEQWIFFFKASESFSPWWS